MKLRNLLYATMVACAFASCSKDEVTDPEVGPAKGEANLSIAIDLAGVSTKAGEADKNAMEGETTINDIQVAVFNGSTLLATGLSGADKKNQATFTGLPVGVDLTCIVLANMPVGTITGLTPAVLTKTLTIPGDKFESGKLPMYALTESFKLEVGENEKVVSVVRNVARIQVSAIKLDMANSKVESGYKSGTAQFDLKSISVNDAAATGMVTGAANAATKYVYGLANYVKDAVSYPYYLSTSLTQSVSQSNFTAETEAASMTGIVTEGKPVYYYYVFANAKGEANPTILTVAGDFQLAAVANDGTKVQLEKTLCYYPVRIGYDGVTPPPNQEVINNKVYDIKLTIIGAGYTKPNPGPDPENPDPDAKKADFTVIATAADWAGVVVQEPIIK